MRPKKGSAIFINIKRMQTEIISPITLKSNCIKLKTFAVDKLVQSYHADFNIPVEHYFKGIQEIELWECKDTGLRFFRPNGLEGDSDFYSRLESFDWYYLPWKWEHEVIQHLIPESGSLLEIGCAEGAFIEQIQKKGMTVTGLELNEKAADICLKKGLKVKTEFIQTYAESNPEAHDWVCSFQVLEHISEVHDFLTACIKTLKTGGKLALSVPNMESFLQYDDGGLLNFPPHHQGWWTTSVFKSLEKYYSLKLTYIGTEPVQAIHDKWFKQNMVKKWYQKNKWFGALYIRLIKLPILGNKLIELERQSTKGHTMLAVFEKLK